jgi:integrase
MPAKKITDAFVRNVKLPPKGQQVRYIHTLTRGLGLVLKVSYGGSRRWSVLTYQNGKPSMYGLGSYPTMKLKEAKKKAEQYFEDPDKVKNAAATGTFREIAERWFVQKKAAHRTAKESYRQLTRYVYPRWKDRPFLQIKRRDIADLIDEIEDGSGPRQANMVLSTIRSICEWWQTRDDDYTSPVVKGMKRDENKAREHTLTDAEIASVWQATAEGTFGGIVRLLLLTAQRRAKVQTMKWSDLSEDCATWTMASEPDEKGHPEVLRLPPAAIDVLKQQPRIGPYVFASERRQGRPFNSFGQAKRALDLKLGFNGWTIHDLRRTARSLLSRVGVSFDHAERVLGHVIPGTAGVYDRHPYEQEIGNAVAKLAAEIARIVNPPPGENVLQFERK